MLSTIGFTSDKLLPGGDIRHRERMLNARLKETVGTVCEMRCDDVEHSFDGRMELCLAPDIVVGYLSGLAVRCRRGLDHIRNDGDDSLFVQLNIGNGIIAGHQFGREYELAPGQATLCVHNAGVEFRGTTGMGLLGITLPRHFTDNWAIPPEDLAARPVSLDHPALRLLAPYARLFQSQPETPDTVMINAATHHMALLIAVGFGAAKPDTSSSSAHATATARVSAIRRILSRDCLRQNLTLDEVAARIGISPRMVQHVLQQSGTSFARLLGQFRAERAHALLRDPALKNVSVAEIGFLCGFSELSAFYRAFRARYDATPAGLRP